MIAGRCQSVALEVSTPDHQMMRMTTMMWEASVELTAAAATVVGVDSTSATESTQRSTYKLHRTQRPTTGCNIVNMFAVNKDSCILDCF